MLREYARILGYIKPYIGIFILALLFVIGATVVGNGASVGMLVPLIDRILSDSRILVSDRAPEFLRGFIDTINGLPRLTLLNYIAIWIVAFSLLREAFKFLQTYFLNDLGLRAVRDVRTALYAKFMGLSMDYYGRNPTGKLVSRIMYDTGHINNAISQTLSDIVIQISQLLFNVVMVLYITFIFGINWRLLVIAFVIMPVVLYPILRLAKRLRKIGTRTMEKSADINTALIETITGISIVKAFSMEAYEVGRFKALMQNFYKLMLKTVKRVQAISPITELLVVFLSVVVIWFGVRDVIRGDYSAGAFGAFLTALLLMVKPFNRLGRAPAQIQQALAASARIFEVLDTSPSVKEKADAEEMPPFKDRISFEDVDFGYGEAPVLKGISFEVKRGEVMAVVGPSGIGKTTLVNLIPRFYDVTKGRIEIDGRDVRDLKIASLLSQIGIVTQQTILFNDTVRANIAYGHIKEINDDRIISAARAANAHDFIERMPQGYDTMIGEKGFRLSGGEKQRLAIARAILKNPPILILDEATSQLDTESERLVQGAIDKLMQGRTVFVIAHRLSTIRHATKIIVLHEGTLAESGTHEELMKKGGVYKRLYEMQFAVAKK